MAKHYEVEVTVSGWTAFPIDMLRYDGLYPAKETDSHTITRTISGSSGRETVQLRTTTSRKDWQPTHRRWASFVWNVEKVELIGELP